VIAADARRQRRRAMALVAAAALLSATAVALFFWPAQGFVNTSADPYHYLRIAREFVSGGDAAHRLTKRSASLYPMAIAGVIAMAGDFSALIIALQCVAFAVTCALTCDIGTRVFNLRTGVIGGFLLAFNPVPLRYVGDLQMETMLAAAVTFSVWTIVRLVERPNLGRSVLAGAAATVAGLTKGVGFVPGAALGLYLLWRRARAGDRSGASLVPLTQLAVMAATVLLLVVPWALRNYRLTGGEFVPIAPGMNDAFLRGYVFSRPEYALLRRPPYIDAENEVNAWLTALCQRAGARFGEDEVRDERIFATESKRLILQEPAATLRKFVVGLATFWYEMTTPFTSAVAGCLALGAAALASAGWKRSRSERRAAWLLLVPVVSMNVFVAALCSLGRYSVPVVPCLVVLAAFGIDTLWAGAADHRRDAIDPELERHSRFDYAPGARADFRHAFG
jgi:4-amino-4-deoxy-L-arabinose transferase-like glycosyltransferase